MKDINTQSLQQGVNLIADINQYVNDHYQGEFPWNNTPLWEKFIKSSTKKAYEQLYVIAAIFHSEGWRSPSKIMKEQTHENRLMKYGIALQNIDQFHHKITRPGRRSETEKTIMWAMFTQLHEIINEYNDPKTILFQAVI